MCCSSEAYSLNRGKVETSERLNLPGSWDVTGWHGLELLKTHLGLYYLIQHWHQFSYCSIVYLQDRYSTCILHMNIKVKKNVNFLKELHLMHFFLFWGSHLLKTGCGECICAFRLFINDKSKLNKSGIRWPCTATQVLWSGWLDLHLGAAVLEISSSQVHAL